MKRTITALLAAVGIGAAALTTAPATAVPTDIEFDLTYAEASPAYVNGDDYLLEFSATGLEDEDVIHASLNGKKVAQETYGEVGGDEGRITIKNPTVKGGDVLRAWATEGKTSKILGEDTQKIVDNPVISFSQSTISVDAINEKGILFEGDGFPANKPVTLLGEDGYTGASNAPYSSKDAKADATGHVSGLLTPNYEISLPSDNHPGADDFLTVSVSGCSCDGAGDYWSPVWIQRLSPAFKVVDGEDSGEGNDAGGNSGNGSDGDSSDQSAESQGNEDSEVEADTNSDGSSTAEGAAGNNTASDAAYNASANSDEDKTADADNNDHASNTEGSSDGTDAKTIAVKNSKVDLSKDRAQQVVATGFEAGEDVSGTLHSEPVDLGTESSDISGTVVFDFVVPRDFEVGTHRVELIGQNSGVSQTVEFEVVSGEAQRSIEIEPRTISANNFVDQDKGVTITVNGFGEGERVDLKVDSNNGNIDGIKINDTADAEGSAVFSIYGLSADDPSEYAGRYGVTAVGAKDEANGNEPLAGTFSVFAGDEASNGSGGGNDGKTDDELPYTGLELSGLGLGIGTLLIGALIVALTRRRILKGN